jgi:hypothetical protein
MMLLRIVDIPVEEVEVGAETNVRIGDTAVWFNPALSARGELWANLRDTTFDSEWRARSHADTNPSQRRKTSLFGADSSIAMTLFLTQSTCSRPHSPFRINNNGESSSFL